MSYNIDDDAHDDYELREKVRKLEEIVHDIYIPQSENIGTTTRNLIGYSFGNRTGSSSGSGGTTTVTDNSKIKNYRVVSGIVTIDQNFKSHVMTLGGDVTIQFDGNINADNLKELLFEIIQERGNIHTVNWPSSVKTRDSIKIESKPNSDIASYLVGFSNDGGSSYSISNTYANRIVIRGDLTDEINYWLNQTEQEGIKYFNDNYESVKSNIDTSFLWVNDAPNKITEQINHWISESANQGLEWIRDNYSTIQSNLEDSYDWVNNAANNITSEINKWINLSANEGLKWIQESYGTIQDNLDTAYDWVSDATSNVTSEINKWINLSAQSGIKWAKNLSNTARTQINSAATWVNQASQNVKNIINTAVSEIESALGNTYSKMKTALSGITTSLSTWLSQQSATINSLIDSALESGTDLFNSIVSSVNSVVSDVGKYITDNAADVANTLKSSFDSIYVGISGFTSDVTDTINEWLDESAQTGLKFFNDLSSSTRTAITTAATWVGNVSTNVKNIISSAGSEIETGLGSVYTNLKSFYNSLSSTVRTVLGNVPSSISEFIFGNEDSSSQGGSNGDVDLKTYDLVNVDRCFFNSNDSIKTNSAYPHITGKSDTGIDKNMLFYVPIVSSFRFFASSSEIMKVSNLGVVSNKPLQANDNLNALKYFNMQEAVQAGYAPNGTTNYAVLFCRPSSSGKTELRVKFQSGTSQLIAVES